MPLEKVRFSDLIDLSVALDGGIADQGVVYELAHEEMKDVCTVDADGIVTPTRPGLAAILVKLPSGEVAYKFMIIVNSDLQAAFEDDEALGVRTVQAGIVTIVNGNDKTPPVVSPPSVSHDGSQFSVEWAAPVDLESPIQDVRLLIYETGAPSNKIYDQSVNFQAQPFGVAWTGDAKTYTVRLTAINYVGLSDYDETQCYAVPGDNIISDVQVSQNGTIVTVTYTSSNPLSNTQVLEVYRDGEGSPLLTMVENANDGEFTVDMSAEPSDDYIFVVTDQASGSSVNAPFSYMGL